jgi:hypothetical protein
MIRILKHLDFQGRPHLRFIFICAAALAASPAAAQIHPACDVAADALTALADSAEANSLAGSVMAAQAATRGEPEPKPAKIAQDASREALDALGAMFARLQQAC